MQAFGNIWRGRFENPYGIIDQDQEFSVVNKDFASNWTCIHVYFYLARNSS